MILMVDDELERISEYARQARLSGWDVGVTDRIEVAWSHIACLLAYPEKLQQERPNVLVLDMMWPASTLAALDLTTRYVDEGVRLLILVKQEATRLVAEGLLTIVILSNYVREIDKRLKDAEVRDLVAGIWYKGSVTAAGFATALADLVPDRGHR